MSKPMLLSKLNTQKVQFKEKKQIRIPCGVSAEFIGEEETIEKHSKYQVGDIVFLQEGFLREGIGREMVDYENLSDLAKPWEVPESMTEGEARTFIKITNVRVQRLCDITEKECLLEGVDRRVIPHETPTYIYLDYSADMDNSALSPFRLGSAVASFATMWDCEAEDGLKWQNNPSVFVYDFEFFKREF